MSKKETKRIKVEIKKLLKRASKLEESAEKMISVCNVIDVSWSGSDLVGHSDFFYGDFETPPHNKRFSVEWGCIHGIPDGWYEKSDEEVLQKIEKDSGVKPKNLDKDAGSVEDEFEKLRRQTIILFSGISKEAATEAEKFNLRTKNSIFNKYWKRRIMTRDSAAMHAGRKVPTHKYYLASASFVVGVSSQLNEFLYLIDKIVAQNGKNNSANKDEESFLKKDFEDIGSKIKNLETDILPVINQRIEEIEKCLKEGIYLGSVFLVGSTLEGILFDLAKKNANKFCLARSAPKLKGNVMPVNQWKLNSLIDVAHELKYLGLNTKKFSHDLKDFRNFMHPREQVKHNFNPDEHTAKICFQVLKSAIDDIL